jgi:hypothetical protein
MAEHIDKVPVPEGGGSVSFERIQLYLERHPHAFNLANEIDFDDRYVGEDWPHRGYALARPDVEALLQDAQDATAEAGEAQEALNGLVEQKRQWAKDADEVKKLKDLVFSMRLNGAAHHFSFEGAKFIEGRGWVPHCKICGKDDQHPAHFANGGARYVDSRDVVRARSRVREALIRTGMTETLVDQIIDEIFFNLPGVKPLGES